MATKSRNYGIELLRILAMLGVIVFYINAFGPLHGAGLSFGRFSLTWLLEVLVLPAMNVFIIISGFVGCRAEKAYPRTKGILRMLFTALFYSVIICLIFKIIYPEAIGGMEIVKAFMPFTSGQYWFLSAYLVLCLFMPLLNRFVWHVSGRTLLFTLLVFLSVFSVYSVLPSMLGDFLALNSGTGAVWFMLLYLVGGFMRRVDLPSKFSRKNWLILLGACYLLTYITVLVFGKMDVSLFNFSLSRLGYIFAASISPTMFLAAVALVCIFAKCEVRPILVPWVKFISSSVYSVYLIHANTFVLGAWFVSLFSPLATANPILTLLLTLIYALCVFVVCLFVDLLRRILFNVIRAEIAVDRVDTMIKDLYARVNDYAAKKLGL